MKLRHLEMALERLEGFDRPTAELEQYQTPAPIAARLLFHALMKGDIAGRNVCDLGCGTGILSCGAALLGAANVVGVDIDPRAIEAAERNARNLGVRVEFRVAEISSPEAFSGASCETVIMNPPFGAQRKHADRPFIDRALALGEVAYGIFNAGSRSFLTEYIAGRAEIDEMIACDLLLKRTFSHHRKERLEIPVEIIRMRRITR
jgi:putative methylase